MSRYISLDWLNAHTNYICERGRNDISRIIYADKLNDAPTIEIDIPKEVIAQITFDEEKLREIVKDAVERFKEEYEVVERPQGKWINGHHINGVDYKRCDQCFAEIEDSFFGESSFDVNFCPNCGADMRGTDNETIRTEDI